MGVIPLASVRIVVIDFCVPEPVIVVPAGRFEHFPDVMVNETVDVSIVAPPSAAKSAPAAGKAAPKTEVDEKRKGESFSPTSSDVCGPFQAFSR